VRRHIIKIYTLQLLINVPQLGIDVLSSQGLFSDRTVVIDRMVCAVADGGTP
jgi:hypothetical protein